jgi:hypothetical protein
MFHFARWPGGTQGRDRQVAVGDCPPRKVRLTRISLSDARPVVDSNSTLRTARPSRARDTAPARTIAVVGVPAQARKGLLASCPRRGHRSRKIAPQRSEDAGCAAGPLC